MHRRLHAAAAAASLLAMPAAAQNPTTPGQIPNPSTYQGSMELQRREQQSAPAAPAPAGPGAPPTAAAGVGGQTPAADWRAAHRVTPRENPLLGRWRLTGVDTSRAVGGGTGALAAMMGPQGSQMAAEMAQSLYGSACKSLFGGIAVQFVADAVLNLNVDGSTRKRTAVEYHTDGRAIAVIPNEPWLAAGVVFEIKGDQAVARLGCILQRGTATEARAQPRAASGAVSLAITAGSREGQGRFVPSAAMPVLLLPRSMSQALESVGLHSPTPLAAWVEACRTRAPSCGLGLQAMNADPVARGMTDGAGRLALSNLPSGHFYVRAAGGGTPRLLWDLPVDLKSGSNSVTLDDHNAVRPP